MKDRCLNQNNREYHNYGGRGISVYDPWIHSFEEWYVHMGYPPSPEHSIERINNNGNYEPGNVKWATREEQSLNKRTNHLIEFNGKTQTLSQWADELGISIQTLSSRFRYGWSIPKILTTPIRDS
jgi:hypothetical protein